MNTNELNRIKATGGKISVIKPVKPQKIDVAVNVTHDKQPPVKVEATVNSIVDVKDLADQVAILSQMVGQLVNNYIRPAELEVVRDARGVILGVKEIIR